MQHVRSILRALLGGFMVLAGVNHFLNPRLYLQIMPPYLPWHEALVALSGVGEIGLGLLVFVPRYRRLAGWGIVALLIAVFPANLHMALNPDRFARIPQWALWLRLPLQAVLIGWAEWCTRVPTSSAPNAERVV